MPNVLIYKEQGGAKQVLESGAELELQSGATLDLQDGVYNVPKVKVIEIAADFDNTEQNSGWTIPANAVILDVFLKVDTADASQTLDVGTDGSGSNDPDGFLDGVSVNGTGVVKGTLLNTGQTKGALLRVDEDGSGALVPEADVSSGGETLTYTGSDTTNTMRGSIHVLYIELA